MGRFLFNQNWRIGEMPDELQTETVTEPITETVAEPTSAMPETGKSVEAQIADMQAALKKANSEAAKYRKQVEAIEQADRARKDAELSEMEKLKQQLADASEKARKLEIESLQRQAAEKAGLPLVLASRLTGATLEELEADAEVLAKTLPKKQPQTGQPTNPGGNAGGSGETDEQRKKRLFGP
jgi:uncharacterized protein (DUF885 family)